MSVLTAARPLVPRPALTITRRTLTIVAAALALAVIHLPWRPRTLCLFRAVTGIPCPFCGGTTAVADLGHGDLRGALAASPLALAMLAAWPFVGAVRLPAALRPKRVRWPIILAVLAASELFQLFRFHIL